METDGFEQLKNQLKEWLQEAEKLVEQIPQTQLYATIGALVLTTFLLLLGGSRDRCPCISRWFHVLITIIGSLRFPILQFSWYLMHIEKLYLCCHCCVDYSCFTSNVHKLRF